MTKMVPGVGETLYSLNVGDAARNREQVLTPVVVRKVGRKYFEASPAEQPHLITQYRLSDWGEHSDYSARSRLYRTPKEWEDEKESAEMCPPGNVCANKVRKRRNITWR